MPFGDDLVDVRIGAKDCALLTAVPLDFDAFLDDLLVIGGSNAGPWRGDFSATLMDRGATAAGADKLAFLRSASIEERHSVWLHFGARVADDIAALVAEARDAGCGFVDDHATINSVREAASRGFQAIIVIAHWRGSSVAPRDVLGDVVAHLRLRAGQHPLAADLLQEIEAGGASVFDQDESATISRVFNDSIDLGFDGGGTTRKALDRLLEGLLLAGNALELRDGFYSAEQIADAIGESWSGVGDFAICHSHELATVVKRGRRDRRILTNVEKIYPLRAIPQYRELFAYLSCMEIDYIAVRAKIQKAFNVITSETYVAN